MDRRMILKSAASLPFIASGIATVAAISAIADLVSKYAELDQQRADRERVINAIEKRPDAMKWPEFRLSELPQKWHLLTPEPFFTEKSLARHFDKLIDYYREQSSSGDMGIRRYSEIWGKKYADQKTEALNMFRPRLLAYEHWRQTSGYAEAIARLEETCERLDELFDAIVDAPVETVTDVRMKAGFLADYYKDGDMPGWISARVVQSMRAT